MLCMELCTKNILHVELKLYFYFNAQVVQVAWLIWIALVGQLRYLGTNYNNKYILGKQQFKL